MGVQGFRRYGHTQHHWQDGASKKGRRHSKIILPASTSRGTHGAALAVTGLYSGPLSIVFPFFRGLPAVVRLDDIQRETLLDNTARVLRPTN
ncbi:hypothetical protein [Xanthomonas vasicola]|uniref:hypothetical protein n=1 Tax=Xanthomonas vasicola TaxID=56459 RepID=UPI0012D3208C|nr:hypothetical protein [Xanthomonas vasicola]